MVAWLQCKHWVGWSLQTGSPERWSAFFREHRLFSGPSNGKKDAKRVLGGCGHLKKSGAQEESLILPWKKVTKVLVQEKGLGLTCREPRMSSDLDAGMVGSTMVLGRWFIFATNLMLDLSKAPPIPGPQSLPGRRYMY